MFSNLVIFIDKLTDIREFQVHDYLRFTMRVEQLNSEGWAKTYLLIDDSSDDVIIIDPVYDFSEHYLQMMEQNGWNLIMSIATHTHADHITACFSLKEKTECEYVMWESTASLGVSRYVNESSKINFSNHEMRFHHVPGHTQDSMLVEIGNYVFTGDFLFTGEGGVGRDDLPSGRMEDHWNSLSVLSKLSGELIVCTGHEPPGTEMQTLDWNRKNNPILNMKSSEEYFHWQIESAKQLGYVSKIKVALPANIFGEIPEEIPWLK